VNLQPNRVDRSTAGVATSTGLAAIVFILITVLLDTLAGSIVGPVMPALLKSLTGGAMAQMSTVYGAMMVIFATMQLVMGPVQGALSDRFGRRPLILLSIAGLGAEFLIIATAPTLTWLFVAMVIAGSASGSVTAALAYVADVSTPDERAKRFGLLTGALSAGAVSGSLIGGFVGEIDPRAPFWLAAGLCAVNFLFGFFVLPESLAVAHRAPLTWRSIHPIGAVASIWRDYPILKGWQAASFLISFGITGVNSIFFLYVTFRFGWTPKALGIYSTFVMVTNLVVQAGLVAKAIRVFGERGALLAGMTVQIVGIAAAGLAPTGWLFTAAVVFLVIGGVAEPARMSIINRVIGPSDRGRLSGADRSIVSLTGILAPGVFAALYASVVGAGPSSPFVGIPFFACAGLMIMGFAVTLWSVNRTSVESA
jgi:DHA1 family tetracycline resistance protein-like MFS transporter